MKRITRLAVVAAILLGACSDDGDDGDARTETTTAEDGDEAGSVGIEQCADLYVAGAVIDDADVQSGCELPDGTTLLGNAIECDDGRTLVTFEDSDPQVWGFVGEPLVEAEGGENAGDPAYGDAFGGC